MKLRACLSLSSALTLASVAILPPACLAANPEPVNSEYLQTVSGGFNYLRDFDGVDEYIEVRPLKGRPNGGPLYLVAHFDGVRPTSIVVPLKTPATVNKVQTISTPPFSLPHGSYTFPVTVFVYADKGSKTLLGKHVQYITFHYVPGLEAALHAGQKAHQ